MEKNNQIVEEKKQKKVVQLKSKVVIDLKNIKEKERENLEKIIEKINDKDFGEEIKLADLFVYAVCNLKEKNIKELQELSLSSWDKIKIEHKKYLNKTGESIALEDFIVMKMKMH